ncbi:MAG: hypothetical protein ABIJ14_04015 [Nanoarchaeota archaeon]
MFRVECPKLAYDRIVKSELSNLILEKKELIKDILLYRQPFWSDFGSEILEESKEYVFNWENKISDKWNHHREMLEFDEVFEKEDFVFEIEPFLIKYPGFLASLVLGEKVSNPEKFGFPSRRSLEESIASFCVGEKHIIGWKDRSYFWRKEGVKNEISSNEHGDFYASQTDISGEDYVKKEKDLFGEREFRNFSTIKETCNINTIRDYQDWTMFLISILNYAKQIGKEKIHEIINWRSVLGEIGFIGTHTTEAFGGTKFDDYLMERPNLIHGKTLSMFPIFIGKDFIPYVKDDKLIYLVEDNNGEISLDFTGRFFEDHKFSKVNEYTQEDLPHMLRATYRLFARDRTLLPKIMKAFLSNS